MSVKVMSRVWDHSTQDGSSLLVLLALADHADEDGVCWPGIERVAAKARVSERQAQRVIKALEEKGEVLTQFQRGHRGGRGYTNRYLIATGMSAHEIEQAMVKRFEVEPTLARRVADYLIDLQNGGNIEGKKPESDPRLELPWIVCKKGDKQGKKRKRVTSRVKRVTSRDKKGDIAMSYEPSENHQEEPPLIHGENPQQEKALTPSRQIFETLADICRCNIKLMAGRVGKTGKELREAGATPESLKAFGEWWYTHKYLGKQDKPPTLPQVKEFWGEFEAFTKRNGATTNGTPGKYVSYPPANRPESGTGTGDVENPVTKALRARARAGGHSS